MTTDAKIETFPQHAIKPARAKPSVAEILQSARTPHEAMSLLRLAYPGMTNDELAAAVEAHMAELRSNIENGQAEIAALDRVQEIAGRDTEGDDKATLGESLDRLAAAGDPDAVALRDHFDSLEYRIEIALTYAAVDADPYWERLPDGHTFRSLPGARHKTPEDLRAAFMESLGDRLIDFLPDDLKQELIERALTEEIEQVLEKKIAAGELERVQGAVGETVYRDPKT